MNPNQTYSENYHPVQETQSFPPPPPQSGAAQNHEIPLSSMSVSQNPNLTGQTGVQGGHQSEYQTAPAQDHGYAQPPPLPQRHSQQGYAEPPQYNPATYVQQPAQTFQPPPQRLKQDLGSDDPSNPEHYMRDPHKLVAYLVPLPVPQIKGVDSSVLPPRFLIWTPPPPPLVAPAEGEKEEKIHKAQRKWQQEVREAKMNNDKLTTWKGAKSRAMKGIDWAMSKTTSSNLDFLGKVADGNSSDSEHDKTGTPRKTVPIEEIVLVFPASLQMTEMQMREEFVNTMLRTKTKAQRDAVIATGLIPIAFGADMLLMFVAWPFGGLLEVDTVWAYASFRGAKTSRSVTKRLESSSPTGDLEKDKLHLKFTPSQRTELLRRYLESECHKIDAKFFPEFRTPPTESEIVEAIGWSPAHTNGAQQNWEDDQWQLTEVKEDIRNTMHKAAKEWDKWCKTYAKNPEKAMKA